MEKLKLQTTDMVDENVRRIGELFPNCLTEAKDENGRPRLSIDFDQLRQELSHDIVEGPEERYQFTWPDKRNAIRLANTPTNDTLRPVRDDETTPTGADSKGKPYCSTGSVNFDTTQNLYIEGDNLQVLKLLREDYLGKIKMIYIDPPYNTGNDFVYNDNFSMGSSEWSDSSGDYDEDGNQIVDSMTKNTEANGRFHTDWLNMIYPRLKVAKDLLSEDGVIFISIDDNEVDNLRKVCNEIFGRRNFVAQFIWEKRLNRENRKEVSVRHDYVLCYSKQEAEIEKRRIFQLPMNEKALSNYGNPDNDPRGPWKSDPAHAQGGHGTTSQFYTLIAPNGKKHELPSGRCWLYTQKEMEKAISDNRIWFGQDGNGVPRIKTYLYAKERGLTPETMLFAKDVSTNEKAKNDLKELFDGIAVFETPKPSELIEFLIRISAKDGLILDFFSGASSTAHAVMQLNAEDGGNRKFIMVQLPEVTDENSEAYKAGYKNLCEIGKERIRRAGKKILEEQKSKQGDLFSPSGESEGGFLDVGFRVLKLDSSNMEDVYVTPEKFTEGSLFANNIKPDRSEEDLLFQVMIEMGIDLSSKIERKEIAGKTVWNVAQNYLLACFDEQVNEAAITEIAKLQPAYFVMRDSSLANDQVADNFEQIWKLYSADTERRIV